MKIDEIRSKSTGDLSKELSESYTELMNLRFRWSTHQLANIYELQETRRSIARIQTVLRERELGIVRL